MKLVYVFMSIMAIGLVGCSDDNDKITSPDPEPTDEIITRLNEFSWDFYDFVLNENDTANIIHSPMAIYWSLASKLAVCRSSTKDEIGYALGVTDIPDSVLLNTLKSIYDLMSLESDTTQFGFGWGVFNHSSYEYDSAYLSDLEHYFGVDYFIMNYQDSIISDSINDFFLNATDSNYTPHDSYDLISPGVATFVNLYFSAQWNDIFDPDENLQEDYYHPILGVQNIEMLFGQTTARFYKDSLVKMVEIPLGDGEFNVILILPADTTWPILNKSIPSKYNIQNWLNLADTTFVSITLPIIDMYLFEERIPALRSMGINQIFSTSTRYYPLANSGRLMVASWFEMSGLKFDNNGTQFISSKAIVNNQIFPTDEIILNHPFYFIIRETSMDINVLMGRVVSPGL